jgi:hypothetical protein
VLVALKSVVIIKGACLEEIVIYRMSFAKLARNQIK